MEWKLLRTEEFKTCIKRFKLNEKDKDFLLEKLEKWFYSESDYFQETHNNKRIYKNKLYELFDLHLPSQKSGKKFGKSAGYRLIMVYNLKTKKAYTGMMFERQELSNTKYSEKRKEYIEKKKTELNSDHPPF